MKVLFYSVNLLERKHYEHRIDCSFDIELTTWTLDQETVSLARGYDAISVFIYDDVSENVLISLKRMGIELIIIRAAGTDHVNMQVAKSLGIEIRNIPDYGSVAVAEHALMLTLAAMRKLKLAMMHTSSHYFGLEGLEGSNLSGKSIGVIGTGKIGLAYISLLKGFNAKVIAYDSNPNENLAKLYGFHYVAFEHLIQKADVISLHIPLNKASKYLMKAETFQRMKKNSVLINTSRGAIVKTSDLLSALDNEWIGAYAADVCEYENGVFHREDRIVLDSMMEQLIVHEKIILTPHIAFATDSSISNMAFQCLYLLEQWYMKKEVLLFA